MNRAVWRSGIILVNLLLASGCGSGGGEGGSAPSSGQAPVPGGATVQVAVGATDPNGDLLSFRWVATEGQVKDVSAPTTEWTLPSGPGLHFLYVLISDGKGGHTEKRIAVSTDGSAVAVSNPVNITPPPSATLPGGLIRGTIDSDGGFIFASPPRNLYVPDVRVLAQNKVSGARSIDVVTNLNGEFIIPHQPPGTYDLYCKYLRSSAFELCGLDGKDLVVGNFARSRYDNYPNGTRNSVSLSFFNTTFFQGINTAVAGHVELADGSSCGKQTELFATSDSNSLLNKPAFAVLLEAGTNNSTIAGSVKINSYGDFVLSGSTAVSKQATVRVLCENAAPVNVPVTIAPGSFTNLPPVIVPNSRPVVASFTASLGGKRIDISLPDPPALPSDIVKRDDVFLAFKGLDSRKGACQYYRAIGAVRLCDPEGNPIDQITFEDWKRQHEMAPYNKAPEVTALYVNKVDLNLTRDMHGTKVAPGHIAYYVCNRLGPNNESQSEIDRVIENARNGNDLVACVAMDYSTTPGVNNNQPFTKFYTFGPTGQLLLSVNLDGRGEKFMPGTCVACHGGDHYAGRFPENGSGRANLGAHFLPFDLANYAFSASPGLTEGDQLGAFKLLNQLLLDTDITEAGKNLIAGWYAAGGASPNKDYVPPSWLAQGPNAIALYSKVIAPSCRTCHVAAKPQYDFDIYRNTTNGGLLLETTFPRIICGGDREISQNHTMPNALVTFNRFWASAGTMNDQPSTVAKFWGKSSCNLTPDPGF